MRIPISTDLKTRTGAPADKDARQKNSYVEVKGDQSVVRKRPSAQGGIAVGTGVAQGGIGLTINGVPTFIGFWADTMQAYTTSGLGSLPSFGNPNSWDPNVNYIIGSFIEEEDPLDDPFNPVLPKIRKYSNSPNINVNPKTNPFIWTIQSPPATRFYAFGSGYDGPAQHTGPTCATKDAALYSWWGMITYKSCPGNPLSNQWLTEPLTVGTIDGAQYGGATAWSTQGHGTDCAFAHNFGIISACTFVQTA